MVMIRLRVPVSAIILGIASASALAAQDYPMHQQSGDILNELRQIRYLLERQCETKSLSNQKDSARRVTLNLIGSEGLGSSTAPQVIVEFTDLQCPFCRRF